MRIIETAHYEAMSQAACDVLVECVRQKPDAMLCIATGSSPTLCYRLFAERVAQQGIDISQITIVKLDEWCGLEKDDAATCEHYVQEHILKPLGISQERYIAFDPMAVDAAEECQRIPALIAAQGGIDCCVLGIGKNGHLGLNEPSDALDPFAHKAMLDTKTKSHAMLSAAACTVTEGYTLGIKNILDAAKVLLLVTGSGKTDAYKQLLLPQITSQYPANYLWLHNQAVCIVDKASVQPGMYAK